MARRDDRSSAETPIGLSEGPVKVLTPERPVRPRNLSSIPIFGHIHHCPGWPNGYGDSRQRRPFSGTWIDVFLAFHEKANQGTRKQKVIEEFSELCLLSTSEVNVFVSPSYHSLSWKNCSSFIRFDRFDSRLALSICNLAKVEPEWIWRGDVER